MSLQMVVGDGITGHLLNIPLLADIISSTLYLRLKKAIFGRNISVIIVPSNPTRVEQLPVFIPLIDFINPAADTYLFVKIGQLISVFRKRHKKETADLNWRQTRLKLGNELDKINGFFGRQITSYGRLQPSNMYYLRMI